MRLRKSKLICFLTATVLSVGATGMDAQDGKEMERFAAGQRLADCLIKGCVVFTGTIQSLGAMEQEPGEADAQRAVKYRKVGLKVAEWFHGKRNGDTVQLLYAQQPEMTKTSLGPWVPWEGVHLAVGEQLLVARWAEHAPRPSWKGKPDDVALVTSDKSLFAPARQAVSLHDRLVRDPREVDKIPHLLRDKPDVAVAGYLVTYVMDGESVRDVDKAAALIGNVIAGDAVPPAGREPAAGWLANSFYRLAEATRKTVTEDLAIAAGSDDAAIANPALTVLVRLATLQMLNLKPHLTEARRHKIAEHYRTSPARNEAEPGHAVLESQLGIR